MTTIAVIGDITPDQARPVIEKWFGAWRRPEAKPNVTLPGVHVNQPSAVNVPDFTQVQDSVELAQQLGSIASIPINTPCNSAITCWAAEVDSSGRVRASGAWAGA
jgi:predicted Zn-dependent peptidase